MNLLAIQLEDYMLPCMWKQNFGIDCMGCGMQRSVNLLFKGDFIAAFYMYPAIFSMIGMFLFLIAHIKFNYKQGHKILLALFIVNISIIVTNFILKTF